MSWSAGEINGGVTHTVSGAKNNGDFGKVARERNGVFFAQGDDENDDGGTATTGGTRATDRWTGRP
jgi:hypothetical protein